jgi:putative transport protein
LKLLSDPLILLFLAILIGQLIGRVEWKQFKLGSSGSLFAGLLMSYLYIQYCKQDGIQLLDNQKIVASQLFSLSLIGFIASVGLLAAKDIQKTLRENGKNFVILSFVVTLTGAICTYFFGTYILPSASVMGTYVGALTSSPGLATALESGSQFGVNGEAMIGLGYSVAYVPGVLLVILYVQLEGRQIAKEFKVNRGSLQVHEEEQEKDLSFSVLSFAFVAALGVLIGHLSIDLGDVLGRFSLGKTGGVLISALFLGQQREFLGLSFEMKPAVLKGIRDIALNMFLAIVGINYGYQVILLGKSVGALLLLAGLVTGGLSIGVGYFVGRKILKIDRVPLVGGLCGGMTSTPGLASAIEAIESDELTVFYGATYPFALLFMILFTNVIAQLLS